MKHVDRLYMKALKIRPTYDDVVIITNETGKWMIEDKEYPSLEAAQDDISNYTRGTDVIVIVNDAPPMDFYQEPERVSDGAKKDQAEHPDADRSKKDSNKGHEYGRKRDNGQQKSKYYHTWV